LFLLGSTLFRGDSTLQLRQARDAYAEAARLDPGFADAWAGQSLCYGRYYSTALRWEENLPRDSATVLAERMAQRALSLDSLSAMAWRAEAYARQIAGDFYLAREAYEQSLRLDSLNAATYGDYGGLYAPSWVTRLELAEPLLRRALALDPDLREAWRRLAVVRTYQGRLAEAEALFDTTLAIGGAWYRALCWRTYVRVLRRNVSGALADLADCRRLGGQPPFDIMMRVSLIQGDSAGARAQLASVQDTLENLLDSAGALRDRADLDRVSGLLCRIAVTSTALGLHDVALTALERDRALPRVTGSRCAPTQWCSPSNVTWLYLQDGATFGPLRDEPRFQRLLQQTRPFMPWVDGRRAP